MLVVHHALSCAGFTLRYCACSWHGSISFVWKPLCAYLPETFVLVLLDRWMEVTAFMGVTPVEESITQRLYCTHQVLFAQSSELLELLGYQELGTSDSAANLPQHWGDNTNQQHTHTHVSECTGICELLYECLFRGFLSIKLWPTDQNLLTSQVPPKAKLFLSFKKKNRILCKLQTQCQCLLKKKRCGLPCIAQPTLQGCTKRIRVYWTMLSSLKGI